MRGALKRLQKEGEMWDSENPRSDAQDMADRSISAR